MNNRHLLRLVAIFISAAIASTGCALAGVANSYGPAHGSHIGVGQHPTSHSNAAAMPLSIAVANSSARVLLARKTGTASEHAETGLGALLHLCAAAALLTLAYAGLDRHGEGEIRKSEDVATETLLSDQEMLVRLDLIHDGDLAISRIKDRELYRYAVVLGHMAGYKIRTSNVFDAMRSWFILQFSLPLYGYFRSGIFLYVRGILAFLCSVIFLFLVWVSVSGAQYISVSFQEGIFYFVTIALVWTIISEISYKHTVYNIDSKIRLMTKMASERIRNLFDRAAARVGAFERRLNDIDRVDGIQRPE